MFKRRPASCSKDQKPGMNSLPNIHTKLLKHTVRWFLQFAFIWFTLRCLFKNIIRKKGWTSFAYLSSLTSCQQHTLACPWLVIPLLLGLQSICDTHFCGYFAEFADLSTFKKFSLPSLYDTCHFLTASVIRLQETGINNFAVWEVNFCSFLKFCSNCFDFLFYN